jgi:hypothetical protein
MKNTIKRIAKVKLLAEVAKFRDYQAKRKNYFLIKKFIAKSINISIFTVPANIC